MKYCCNIKKMKSFFVEGEYKMDVFFPDGSPMGMGSEKIENYFDEGYVLLLTTWQIGEFPETTFTSKFFVNGSFTQVDTSGRDISGKWFINGKKLCIEIKGIDFQGVNIKGRYNSKKLANGYHTKYYQLNNKKCELVYSSVTDKL